MKSVAVHITIPEELLKEVDEQAEQKQRNRSEILREAIGRPPSSPQLQKLP